MPNLSSFKNSIISALRTPHEGSKPRLKRRVIPFNEAFENLKTSKGGVVTCVAFHHFGKCRKEIPLFDSGFLADLDKLNLADVQTPIKLMPLMLCSSHWEKTVYHNALFLDWLSTFGSKQDNQHYENIVIDYQSAVAIDDEEDSLPKIPTSSEPIAHGQGGEVDAPNTSTNEPKSFNSTDFVHIQEGRDKPLPLEPEHDLRSGGVPEISVLISMDAFASIEFGVAKLEIMYQDNLRCIAMTSDGWRCQEIIHQEQLLKARELLGSSVTSGLEVDIVPLSPLVLCSGHAQGDLPRIYTEKWTSFTDQRLPKEEAMRKFNAEFWMTVQFFPSDSEEQPAFLANKERRIKAETRRLFLAARRPRSTSDISTDQHKKDDTVNNETAGRYSLWSPLDAPFDYKRQKFDFTKPEGTVSAFEWNATIGKPTALESRNLSDAHSADDLTRNSQNFETSATASSYSQPLPVRNTDLVTSMELDDDDAPNPWAGHLDTSASRTMSAAFSSLNIADQIPQQEQNTSSASKAATEASIPPEEPHNDQKANPEVDANASSIEGAAKQAASSDSQESIYNSFIKEISSPIVQGGFVDVSRSIDLKLVRIGEEYVKGRRQNILGQCQLANSQQTFIHYAWSRYPDRVARLVHLELQIFRAGISCQDHLDAFTGDAVEQEHEQWFDVPDAVAVASVNLWKEFVDHAYTSSGFNGTIKEHWTKMVSLLPKPTDAETLALEAVLRADGGNHLSDYHLLRNKRYSKWVEDGKRKALPVSRGPKGN